MKAWQVTAAGEPSQVMSQTDKELGEVGPAHCSFQTKIGSELYQETDAPKKPRLSICYF